MTENILKLLGDFLKNNNIGDLDLGQIIKNLPLDQIMAMINGKDEYVVKRSGNLEKYDPDKIARSIKNAAARSDMQLNQSDITMILKDIGKKLLTGNEHVENQRVHRTTDIKDIVLQVLAEEGFSKIRDSFDSYTKDQN
ncbi:ATP cone domain-containing protein [uncultured Anaerococcus sp.]|uniref:ATP cone domain-containing protein n=1 Tax=uncultured Anaerococcus sp. TaxID=293428 RepID=UPI002600A56E|nr:ATP cone domain-containing protein [uncultured Anaerococcus sp.]